MLVGGNMHDYDLITILGPTACGKTKLAAAFALACNAEIISADSRQVYRGMDIGTGKDLEDYRVQGKDIPYHVIDIADAGEKYNLFEYQRDFFNAYNDIKSRGVLPVLCGGTGLYIESVLKGYRLLPVPENRQLRQSLAGKTLEELTGILASYKTLHNNTDTDTVKRAIRAIEIEEYYREHDVAERCVPTLHSLIVGIDIDRDERRRRISERLAYRLEHGLVEEVERLLSSGISPDDLIYYGLEYKYVTLYVTGRMDYDEMRASLEVAIHRFAKRQMTWFRGMERRGFRIEWLPWTWSMEHKIEYIKSLMTR